MIANFFRRADLETSPDGGVTHDPEVRDAVAENRVVLERNRQLVTELAAVERALRRRSWKTRTR